VEKVAYLRNVDTSIVEITLEKEVSKGDILPFGERAVVTGNSGIEGDTIVCFTKGIFEIQAKSDDEFNYGDKVYFNEQDRIATKDSDGNIYLGLNYSKKIVGETFVRVGVGEF